MSAENSEKLSTRAARGASVTAFAQLGRLVVQLAGLVVLARLLPPEDFGLVAMSSAIVGLGDVLRDFGLSSAAVQAKSLSRAQASNLFWVNAGMGLILTTTVLGIAPALGLFYGDERVTWITLAIAGTFLINGLQVQIQVQLIRAMRFGAVSGSDLFAQVVGLALAVIAAIGGLSYWALVIQLVAQPFTLLVTRALVARWYPGKIDRSGDIRGFVRYGSSLVGTQVAVYVSSNVDSVIMGSAFGAQPLGLYNRAYQALVLPLSQFLAPMTNVALPVLSKLNAERYRFQRYLEHAQLVVAYVTATVYALLASVARDLIPMLFGPAWQDTAYFFVILAVGGIFQAANYSSYWVYLAMAKTGSHFRYSLAARTLLVACLLVGAVMGPFGIAAGYSLAMVLALPLSMVWLARTTGVDVRPISFITLRSSTLALIAGAAGYSISFLELPPPLRATFAGLVTLTTIALAAAALSPYRRDIRGLLIVVSQLRRGGGRTESEIP